jgi:hypothetical protein
LITRITFWPYYNFSWCKTTSAADTTSTTTQGCQTCVLFRLTWPWGTSQRSTYLAINHSACIICFVLWKQANCVKSWHNADSITTAMKHELWIL